MELTKEQLDQVPAWAEKWKKIILDTTPMTGLEKEKCRKATIGMYKAAGYEPPKRILFARSPFAGALAATTARDALTALGEGHSKADVSAAVRDSVHHGTMQCFDRLVGNRDKAESFYRETLAVCYKAVGRYSAARPGSTVSADKKLVDMLNSGHSDFYSMYNGGNCWGQWPALVSFYRWKVKPEGVDFSKWKYYETLARHSGYRYMHEEFCIITDRPELIAHDENDRPHNEFGPSRRWRDGVETYHWRGVRVPGGWINDKDSLDPREVLQIENVELRRVAVEIVGWAKVLKAVDSRVINDSGDPEVGILLEADLPEASGSRFLFVRCGTGREFALPVPDTVNTALEANAWTYGVTPEQYKCLQVRT